MKLLKADFKNYRSLSSATLRSCGSFNVLIGKNNSGKSAILAAVRTFFSAIQNGQVINLDPGTSLRDFSGQSLTSEIAISCDFELDSEQRQRLVEDLLSERPEVKLAIDALPSTCVLAVEVHIKPPPQGYSQVSSIALLDAATAPIQSHLLFSIDGTAATELAARAQNIAEADQFQRGISQVLSYFDRDDWSRAKARDPGAAFYAPSQVLRRMFANQNPRFVRDIETAMADSKSFEDFQNALRNLSAAQEAVKVEKLNVPLSKPLKTFAGEERVVPSYVTSLLKSLASTKVTYLTEYRKSIGAEEAQKLLNLKTKRGGTETFQSIQTTVSDLLGVRVDAFSAEVQSRDGPTAELDVDEYLVEMNGSGIREALRLVLDTAFERPQLLLVEEPEIHLHPGLETSVMRFLQAASSSCQVFITTHSTNFLDQGSYQNVYLVSKTKWTEIDRLEYEEIEEKVPLELGIRLSSLFMYDRLCFVEGPSDELVIREIAKLLDINLSQRNVGFVPLNGIGNLGHYAAKEILDFLSKRRVRLGFLIDRDERAEHEIERIRKRLGADVTFTTTRARELENYLVSPSAIKQHLERRLAETSLDHVSEGEIQARLAKCADSLKNYAVWKKLAWQTKPIYPVQTRAIADVKGKTPQDLLRDDISAAITELNKCLGSIDSTAVPIIQNLEERWSSEKFAITPGSLLLDELYKTYGLRFEKTRDSAQLASCLSREDVDDDLRRFILNIANS